MYPQFHNNFAMAFGDEFDSKKIGAYDMVGFLCAYRTFNHY